MAETKKSCIGEDVTMEFTKEEIEEIELDATADYILLGYGHLSEGESVPKEFLENYKRDYWERKNLPELTYEDYKPVLDVLDKYWDGQ